MQTAPLDQQGEPLKRWFHRIFSAEKTKLNIFALALPMQKFFSVRKRANEIVGCDAYIAPSDAVET